MDNSQQPPPAQAQHEPLMSCCQKDNIRDCECLIPQGPCTTPGIIVSHYSHRCRCYSCEWIREARKAEVPNHLGSESSGLLKNPTYAGHQLDDVCNANSRKGNDLEHIYPVLAHEQAPQQWGWVLQPPEPLRLPYLATDSQCPWDAKRVTLGSNGKWKAILPDGRSIPVVYHTPWLNELYRDYGYHPKCSPYSHGSLRSPVKANPRCYAPQPPPNRLREYAADVNNATLCIGGIKKNVSNDELKFLFGDFGQIRYFNRSFESNAFVQFALRRDALMALRQLQGVPVYDCRLRISWGKPMVKNQDEFPVMDGILPYKGDKHRQPQQPQQPQPQPQPFNAIPWPGNQQQQYQSPHAPPANAVWHYVPGHQQGAYHHGGFDGYQPMARPPPPSFPLAALSHQPAGPQDGQTSRPSRLNPCAASWKGNLKGKGPVVAYSVVVPDPSQQPRDQQAEESSTSSRESPQIDASTGDSQSDATTGRTSPEGRDDREIIGYFVKK